MKPGNYRSLSVTSVVGKKKFLIGERPTLKFYVDQSSLEYYLITFDLFFEQSLKWRTISFTFFGSDLLIKNGSTEIELPALFATVH